MPTAQCTRSTYVLLQNVLDLAQLIGQLLVSVLAQVFVCFAALSHLDTKLESSLGVGFFAAFVLCPLLLCVKVIPGASFLLQTWQIRNVPNWITASNSLMAGAVVTWEQQTSIKGATLL